LHLDGIQWIACCATSASAVPLVRLERNRIYRSLGVVVAGTYEGQWLRGVRHGYGVRQSVSYDLAVRFPIQSAFSAVNPANLAMLTPPGVLEKEDDVMLRERDMRVEESRGGFVLLARTTPLDRDSVSGSHRRMVLDKHGKPSLRKTIASVRNFQTCITVLLLFFNKAVLYVSILGCLFC